MICGSANYHWVEVTSGVFVLVVFGHLTKIMLITVHNIVAAR